MNISLNEYFTEWVFHWMSTSLNEYFTEWVLHWMITSLNGYFTEWVLHWMNMSTNEYFTEWVLYWMSISLNEYCTEWLLHWMSTSLNECFTGWLLAKPYAVRSKKPLHISRRSHLEKVFFYNNFTLYLLYGLLSFITVIVKALDKVALNILKTDKLGFLFKHHKNTLHA